MSGQPLQTSKGEQEGLESRIISAIAKVGPRNIAEISRITGAPRETIRYEIKKRFKRRGFTIHAQVDYGKIGLTPYWGSFHFTWTHSKKAAQLFRLLNKVGYLISYGKTLPNGRYAVLFALPEGKREHYRAFLQWLQSKGLFSDFTFDEALVHHHPEMNPKFFNFRSCRWDANWNEIKASPTMPFPARRETSAHKEDYYDLLILKELQKDALKRVAAIARILKLNHKTLGHHYRNHVLGQKMISSYWVRWETSKALAHSVALIYLRFRARNENELKRVQAVVSKIPFLWMEDILSDHVYVVSMYVSFAEMTSALAYIDDELPDLGSKVDINLVKFSEALTLTIPYQMWKDGEWTFDIEQMKAAVEQECLQATEE